MVSASRPPRLSAAAVTTTMTTRTAGAGRRQPSQPPRRPRQPRTMATTRPHPSRRQPSRSRARSPRRRARRGSRTNPAASCRSRFQEPDKPAKSGGTLVQRFTFDPGPLDAAVAAAGGTMTGVNVVYSRLLGVYSEWDSDPYARNELVPELADAWEISEDGLTYNIPPAAGREVPQHRAPERPRVGGGRREVLVRPVLGNGQPAPFVLPGRSLRSRRPTTQRS